MAKVEFELEHGLEINGMQNKTVVMRDITAGDIIFAEESSETCYMTTKGPVVMSSPTQAMLIVLSRVIESIGDIKPVSQLELKKLLATDFDIIQKEYLKLRGENELAELGRDSEPLR